jgi:hypothetical protein
MIAAVADDTHVSLPFSPSGATSVEIEWIVPDGGRFGRDRSVPRVEATHAKITEYGGTQSGSRTVLASEADALIRDVQLADAERQAKRETAAAERKQWLASLTSDCPRCQTPREYAGKRRVQTGGVMAEEMFGVWAMANLDVHIYACRRCGSIELFADGPVPHPLPGNPPARR